MSKVECSVSRLLRCLYTLILSSSSIRRGRYATACMAHVSIKQAKPRMTGCRDPVTPDQLQCDIASPDQRSGSIYTVP